MELKWRITQSRQSALAGFNCTFMELKLESDAVLAERIKCFNCTFMELKSCCKAENIKCIKVIIVPLWN